MWRRTAARGAGAPRRGQSLVELALMLPLITLILLGAVDLGRAFYSYVELTNAVKQGAAYGTLSPSDRTSSDSANPNNIAWQVQHESGLTILSSDITVRCYQGPAMDSTTLRGSGDCSKASGVTDGDLIEVRARAAFSPITTQILGFLPSSFKLGKTVRMVIQ